MRLRPVFLAMLSLASFPVFAQITSTTVATYDGGTVSDLEISVMAEIDAYPYSDPLETSKMSSDPTMREDAKEFIRTGAEEVLWIRETAKRFKSMGFLPHSVVRQANSDVVENCRQQAEAARDVLTTLTTSQLLTIFRETSSTINTPETRDVRYMAALFGNNPTEQTLKEKRERMEVARRRVVEGGEKFSAVAKEMSEVPSAANGGAIGTVRRIDKFNPRVMDLIFRTEAGTVSQVEKLHNGFYVVNVTATLPEVRYTERDVVTSESVQRILMGYAGMYGFVKPKTDAEKQILRARCEIMAELLSERAIVYETLRVRERGSFEPTAKDIEAYYRDNLANMMDHRKWKLSHVRIPAGGVKEVATRRDAAAKLEQVRSAMKAGTPDAELLKQFASVRLTIEKGSDWTNTAGSMEYDMHFNKLAGPGLSDVSIDEKGALFVRLDEYRESRLIPLAEKSKDIEEQVRNSRFSELLRTSRESLAKQKGLKVIQ